MYNTFYLYLCLNNYFPQVYGYWRFIIGQKLQLLLFMVINLGPTSLLLLSILNIKKNSFFKYIKKLIYLYYIMTKYIHFSIYLKKSIFSYIKN
jgi:hypothetical protein